MVFELEKVTQEGGLGGWRHLWAGERSMVDALWRKCFRIKSEFMVIVRAQPWSSGRDHIVTKQDSYLRQLSTVC